MSGKDIELTVEDGVAIIALDDPAAMNAVSPAMLDNFLLALDEVESSARVMVLTGKGRCFCAGANLSRLNNSMGTTPDEYDPGTLLGSHINPILNRLRAFSIPWIAAVNGPAVGVGCGFALGADLIVAARSAFFQFAFARVGLAPDGGSSYLLSRAVGRTRAAELLLLGERLSAEQALEWGLINRVFENESFMQDTLDLAAKLAAGPTRSYSLAREALWAGLESDYAAALDLERSFQRVAGQSSDHREGLDAFKNKREAQFLGR